MNDITGTLIFQAVLRRAALMEQWLVKHKEHFPGPHTEVFVDDLDRLIGKCSCGASIDTQIVISIVSQERLK